MPELFALIGLPGAGKTTRARQLAADHRALRLSPDEWMLPLFGAGDADDADDQGNPGDAGEAGGKRDIVEACLLRLAWDALRIDTNVVLDFGFWSRDERSAMRWLAASAGAACHLVYLPIDHAAQLERVALRQAAAPHETVPMSEADLLAWRALFEEPDDAELSGGPGIEGPPPGSISWFEWTARRWPTLILSEPTATSPTATKLPATNAKGPDQATHTRPEPRTTEEPREATSSPDS